MIADGTGIFLDGLYRANVKSYLYNVIAYAYLPHYNVSK